MNTALRRTLSLVAPVIALLLPTLVWADTPPVLSFKTGPVYSITQTSMGIAWGGVFLGFVLAVFFEFAHSSHHGKHEYGAIVMRTMLIAAGLRFYGTIFGTVVSTAAAIGNHVTPQQAYTQYWDASQAHLKKLQTGNPGDLMAAATGTPTAAPGDTSILARTGQELGGAVFSSLLSILIFLCLCTHKLFNVLGTVIVGFLYAIGPLVLAAGVPRQTGVLGTWFRSLVTIACWPIVNGILTQFVYAISMQWTQTGQPVEVGALFDAVVMVALALTTPMLTSSLIGGIGNVASPGLEMMAAGVATAAYVTQKLLQDLKPDKKKDQPRRPLDGRQGAGAPGGQGARESAPVITNAPSAQGTPGHSSAPISSSAPPSNDHQDGGSAAVSASPASASPPTHAEDDRGFGGAAQARGTPDASSSSTPGGHTGGAGVVAPSPVVGAVLGRKAGSGTQVAGRKPPRRAHPVEPPAHLKQTKEAHQDDLIRAGAANPPVGLPLGNDAGKPGARPMAPNVKAPPARPAEPADRTANGRGAARRADPPSPALKGSPVPAQKGANEDATPVKSADILASVAAPSVQPQRPLEAGPRQAPPPPSRRSAETNPASAR